MAKLTLADVVNLENQASAVGTVNANSALIETALENTLSRDGTSPNSMGADLDMDSFRILNLPEPASALEPLRLIDLDLVTTGSGQGVPLGGNTGQALTKNSDTNFDTEWSTIDKTWVGLGSVTNDAQLKIASNLSDVASVSTSRTNLGLGTGDSPQFTAVNVGAAADTTLSRASAGDLNVEGNLVYRAGGTDVPITDGGTGASTAAGARTNLGVTETGGDTTYLFRANNLSDVANAGTSRTNLGLGTIATQDSNNVTITGGSVTGITDLAVADGGTGASTEANARTNLGLIAGGAGDIWVEKAGDTMTGGLTMSNANITVARTSGTAQIVITSDAGANIDVERYSANVNAPVLNMRKSRGTTATPAVVNTNDRSFQLAGAYYDGAAHRNGFLMQNITTEATPGSGAMGTRTTIEQCPVGSGSLSELLRFEHATGLSMFGTNPVIDQSRHHRLRSYTTAGLPAVPAAGSAAYTSDAGIGALSVSNGTDWMQFHSGTYTPTLTGVANINALVASLAQYMRVGKTVTVSGKVSVDATAAGANTEFGISLPVASNFANDMECSGMAVVKSTSFATTVWHIYADTTNDRAHVRSDVNGAPSTSPEEFMFHFTYQII
jgi:hypothetical protein